MFSKTRDLSCHKGSLQSSGLDDQRQRRAKQRSKSFETSPAREQRLKSIRDWWSNQAQVASPGHPPQSLQSPQPARRRPLPQNAQAATRRKLHVFFLKSLAVGEVPPGLERLFQRGPDPHASPSTSLLPFPRPRLPQPAPPRARTSSLTSASSPQSASSTTASSSTR